MILSSLAFVLFTSITGTNAFTPSSLICCPFLRKDFQSSRNNRNSNWPQTQRYMSSIGDGRGDDNNRPPPPPGGEGPLDDFLDPKKSSSESDALKRARVELSDSSLPISFKLDDDENENIPTKSDNETTSSSISSSESSSSSSLITSASATSSTNPFLEVVSNLSPSDLISKFTSTAHPRVQDAVRSTILSLIGTLPQMAFETTTITTGERLASLMFQLQMSGYMFKNAEYRLSLSQSLKQLDGRYLLPEEDDDDDEEAAVTRGKPRGQIKIMFGRKKTQNITATDATDGDNDTDDTSSSTEVEVDAQAYTSELRDQVSKLRASLTEAESQNEQVVQKDLLQYIRTLPKQELQSLTGDMSGDVLEAMKGLVKVVMNGIAGNEGNSEGDEATKIGPDTVTEQSGEAMAQLCMWQLVVGYNLRELEVREEMKNKLQEKDDQGEEEKDESKNSSIDFDKGGFE